MGVRKDRRSRWPAETSSPLSSFPVKCAVLQRDGWWVVARGVLVLLLPSAASYVASRIAMSSLSITDRTCVRRAVEPRAQIFFAVHGFGDGDSESGASESWQG